MSLDEIQKLAQKPHKTTVYRHEESTDHLARGMECMRLAQDEQFQNPNLLLEAVDCFMEAIKFNRKEVEPYLGLGFIFMLYEQYQQAKQYLEVALHLEPQNEDVHALLQSMPQKAASPLEKALDMPVDLPEIDTQPKSLDEIQYFLQDAMHALSEEKLATIKPSVNELYIQRLQDKLRTWQYRYKQLSHWVSQAHAPEFVSQLDPLKARMALYQEALDQSDIMVQLSGQMREDEKTALEYIELIENGSNAAEDFSEHLEILLDNCDNFADQLDVLEERGFQVGTLNSHYQNLLEKIDQLQDLVEA